MFSLTFFGFAVTSNPEIKASPDVGFSKVVRIIIVVLFPAPLGPKKPKISPFSTENETSFTAITSPKDLVRDLVSIEYNTLIAFFNYKLLSIILVDPHKKFKAQIKRPRHERVMPKMSFIKCRNIDSRWNSNLRRLF